MGTYIGHRRDEFFLASKCVCPIEFPAGALPPYPHDYSPGNVRADVEQSLRRLRTDCLDLVQVHMSPSKAILGENHTVETLKDASEDKNWRTGPLSQDPHVGPLPADLYEEAKKRLPFPEGR
jgi:aryl-alcohol dehydrogenase-like predicted oxidoreductase